VDDALNIADKSSFNRRPPASRRWSLPRQMQTLLGRLFLTVGGWVTLIYGFAL
jgi:hypothetical protein